MHILQTRPQGERSAVEGLERRGVAALSPSETIRVRKRARGGRTETVDKVVKIMPGYVVATPERSGELERALGDMAVREPRRDVTRVVGRISTRFDEYAIHGILRKHGGVTEPKSEQPLAPGDIARITAGALEGIRVRIQSIRSGKARVVCGKFPAEVPLEHLELVDPQRHPPT